MLDTIPSAKAPTAIDRRIAEANRATCVRFLPAAALTEDHEVYDPEADWWVPWGDVTATADLACGFLSRRPAEMENWSKRQDELRRRRELTTAYAGGPAPDATGFCIVADLVDGDEMWDGELGLWVSADEGRFYEPWTAVQYRGVAK